MIATAKFPLQATVPNPNSTSDSRFSGAVLSFGFGFARRSRSGGGGGELWVVNERGEMGFLQQLRRRGCFKGLCSKKERKVEVEAANGGEDLFDAAAAESRVQPDHLVIMVNGIIGRYKLLSDFVEFFILLAQFVCVRVPNYVRGFLLIKE